MSLQLLKMLNGQGNGPFSRFLSRFDREPNICWYPSSGLDFRDTIYLSPEFAEYTPADSPETCFPDIFLHTDYFPWERSSFLDTPIIFMDDRTTIRIAEIEELPRLNLPRHPALVHFTDLNHASNRVIYLELSLYSNKLGFLKNAHVLYVFAENTAFCAEVLLPAQASICHLIHVRYGGGCGGGGTATGAWLWSVAPQLGCKYFITDGQHVRWQPGDRKAIQIYPELKDGHAPSFSHSIRKIPSKAWSGYGDVNWLSLKTQ